MDWQRELRWHTTGAKGRRKRTGRDAGTSWLRLLALATRAEAETERPCLLWRRQSEGTRKVPAMGSFWPGGRFEASRGRTAGVCRAHASFLLQQFPERGAGRRKWLNILAGRLLRCPTAGWRGRHTGKVDRDTEPDRDTAPAGWPASSKGGRPLLCDSFPDWWLQQHTDPFLRVCLECRGRFRGHGPATQGQVMFSQGTDQSRAPYIG